MARAFFFFFKKKPPLVDYFVTHTCAFCKRHFIVGMISRHTTGSADLRRKEDLGLLTTKGAVHGTRERPRLVRQAQ